MTACARRGVARPLGTASSVPAGWREPGPSRSTCPGRPSVTALLPMSVAGSWSDRLGRRKIFVNAASVGMAVSLLLPALAPNIAGMLAYAFLAGLSFGVYIAVDTALMSEVLPPQDAAATHLGILNIAATLPQVLGPGIASAALLALGGGDSYEPLFVVAALLAVLGAVAITPSGRCDEPDPRRPGSRASTRPCEPAGLGRCAFAHSDPRPALPLRPNRPRISRPLVDCRRVTTRLRSLGVAVLAPSDERPPDQRGRAVFRRTDPIAEHRSRLTAHRLDLASGQQPSPPSATDEVGLPLPHECRNRSLVVAGCASLGHHRALERESLLETTSGSVGDRLANGAERDRRAFGQLTSQFVRQSRSRAPRPGRPSSRFRARQHLSH